ncbi:pentatricopeptide repeat-containing protein At5g59600-like [Chenopodium quinoa]|nr:pentatricopeptide repeat-containing protein At5g59600-like [Chenopodium quinoa]
MFPIFRLTIFLTSYNRTHFINRSLQTSSDSYIKCIENYTLNRSSMSGKALHAHLIINGLANLSHIASKLIAMYVECRELGIAHQVFDEMPECNYRRWIALIGAYAKCGFYRQALDFLCEMVAEGVKPNNFVLPSALKACGHLLERRTGEEIHGFSLRRSFHNDVFVGSALIDMYSKCGFVDKARKVFDNMIEKDLVALNAMVAGYVHVGLVKEALSFVENVQVMKLRPNVVTWNTLIAGFSQAGDSLMVDELFQVMRDNKIEPDVVSWTSIISGLVKNFKNDEAFVTFQKMMDSGCFPNTNTVSTLLSACANVANVSRGKEIHGFALGVELERDIYVQSALIDMYAKCGCISQASTLFHNMTRRNTPTWNSMIFGYANHGYCKEAIELFKRMEIEDAGKLSHLTFTAVLTACSHGGMIDLGRSLYESMQENYNIKPRLEHYACMVDLLGRAGKLTEAYDLINAMPIQPDLFVWGALLGACRQHGNIELAEVAAKHLSELEPKGSGTSLLSNLYAGAGSWGNAARLKKLMKKKRSKNFPGCSWIEAA